jgi:hypothetical protein
VQRIARVQLQFVDKPERLVIVGKKVKGNVRDRNPLTKAAAIPTLKLHFMSPAGQL